jgi:hypothetical protein
LAHLNRGALSAPHLNGILMPVEEPSTASTADLCTAANVGRFYGAIFAKLSATATADDRVRRPATDQLMSVVLVANKLLTQPIDEVLMGDGKSPLVPRLMTSSKLLGVETGRSVGAAPSRMLRTKLPALR